MRHDRDAAGDPALLEAKAVLRERIWERLTSERASRFPGAHGRIPHFRGAEEAARRLADTESWKRARSLKCNPDAPQLPVRQRALEDGKRVYMAVPRLADPRPFVRLAPEALEVPARKAASIKGASRHGVPVAIEDLEPFDLVVTGCVAAGHDGGRLGKGGGFSDLELAIAAEVGLVSDDTPVVTTIHDLQLLEAGAIPRSDHDFELDRIVTPTQTIETTGRAHLPFIRWDALSEEKIAAIPVLQALREQ